MHVSVVESDGHRVCSPYAELFWTPVLGPTSTLLWGRLAMRHGEEVDIPLVGRELGILNDRIIYRALDRLVAYNVATRDEERTKLWVRLCLPTLSPKRLEHLPEHLQERHRAWARDRAAL